MPLLRLKRALPQGERRPRSGFPGERRHSDAQRHGNRIKRTVADVMMLHKQRPKMLGIEPRLLLVLELGAHIDAGEFRKAGMRVVDSSDQKFVVAFSDDPQLTDFRRRLDAFIGGVPEGRQSEPYAQFFDAINNIRQFEPEDRVTSELKALINNSGNSTLRVDIECWHPGDSGSAQKYAREVEVGIESIGGRVADTLFNDSVGLLLLRAYIPAQWIMDVADLDVIARMDVLPQPALSIPQLFNLTADELPEVQAPDANSPIVGVVDSGVASGHDLIGAAVLASDAIGTGIDEDQDEHGHGTMVASLLLYGDVQESVARGQSVQPICRIVSARVLDANNEFPVGALWESDLSRAIEWCAKQGAKIINLSIGDKRYPFSPPKQLRAAAIVDDLARRLGLVIVVAAGNSNPRRYHIDEMNESVTHEYPKMLLDSDTTGVLDPGTSVLSLTVGGLVEASASGTQSGSETLRRVPMGKRGWPSPITRKGPGPGQAVKPELVEHSGTLGFEDGNLIANDAELGVVGARAQVGRLLCWDIGTSYAVPLVSRVAAAVTGRFPKSTAEQIRALVLLSAERVPFADNLKGANADKLEAERALVGYGRPSTDRAIKPTGHRALLVAEDRIPINGVHIYEIPIPSTFQVSGGRRGLDVALAYSPPTRVQRLDYMASRMEFLVVKGLSLEEVAQTFSKVGSEDASTLSELGSKHVVLEPSMRTRSRGANQLGRKVFHIRLDLSKDNPMLLIVRNILGLIGMLLFGLLLNTQKGTTGSCSLGTGRHRSPERDKDTSCDNGSPSCPCAVN